MSDNKKYYYMRLKENFFDTNEMKILEAMQDGYKYSNILLKLYLMSLKDDGRLMLNDRIPYNSQMIATITRHSVGDVEKALKAFCELGLITILESGEIYMMDIQNFIGKSSSEGDRKRIYRQKIEENKTLEIADKTKVSESNGTNVRQSSTRDRDRDRDRDIDIDIDIEKDINTISSELQAHSPVFISLPLNDKTFRDITEDEITQYQELYPNVNVSQELRNMLGWLNANPTKRKTRRGINKFVNNWLSRSQDKGQQTSTTAKANEKGTWWF